MHRFVSFDWLILLLSLGVTVGIAANRRREAPAGKGAAPAGVETVPRWVAALALAGVGGGALEAVVLGAAGARFGLAALWAPVLVA
ncbi:MAG: hypothetical protein WCE75_10575, partial [Terracidiphilus sp.]